MQPQIASDKQTPKAIRAIDFIGFSFQQVVV
jgi:hypothetical protein